MADPTPVPGTRRRRVLVTGATGFIGRHVVAALQARGDDVLVLSRRPEQVAAVLGPEVEALGTLAAVSPTTRIDAIVNLAGAPILGPPWTTARRRVLQDSRIETTQAVVKLCSRLAQRPAVLVSASAIGYYGPRGAVRLDEHSPPQSVFQSCLCQAWEEAATGAAPFGVRVVLLRFGVVLGRGGGALPQLARPVRWGLGAVLGSGQQGAPWIHIADATRLVLFALDTASLHGPVNAVAPEDVTHAAFQASLGRTLRRPIWLRVPAFALRSLLGEMAQLLVDGQHVAPVRALAAGFVFEHPVLAAALHDLLIPPLRP